MKGLRISPTLSLPLEAVTESFGVLGQRGAGKSNVGVVMAEEMHRAQLPWVAIDPKGDWWGVRSSADGRGPGLSVPVLGGLHGDVPLEAAAGVVVADLVVDENLTAVLDVSDFTLEERHRFLLEFAQRLYRRHRRDPQPRHVFLEEAHEYIPQQVGRDRARVKEAVARIPLMGRSFGLGSTTMSQRSARLHKDVLTQVGTLIAMRTAGPQDKKAILEWVEEHAVARELVASLAELDDGEAWVWSPRFLRLVERVQMRRRATYDSGGTPGVGKQQRAPATLADVDLDALTARMAATIEKAKADDPRELRRRIAALERELAKRPTETQTVEVEKIVEVPVLDGQAEQLLEAIGELRALIEAASVAATEKLVAFADAIAGVAPGTNPQRGRPAVATRPREGGAGRPDTPRLPAGPAADGELGELGKGVPAKMLAALAQFPDGRTKKQLAALAGVKLGGSTWRAAVARLRKLGYVEGVDPLRITDTGLAAAGPVEELPTGHGLYLYWRTKLGNGAASAFLGYLYDAWPGYLTKAELCDRYGCELGGSTMRGALATLRKFNLAEGMDPVQLADVFEAE